MASKPNKLAVTITPLKGAPSTVLVDDQSAANRLHSLISDESDAAATICGAVHELAMVLHGDFDVDDVEPTFGRDFRRSTEGRKLVELRDVERVEDDDGVFWRATALWAINVPPAADKEA